MRKLAITLLATSAIAAFGSTAIARSCAYYLDYGADAYFECLDRTQA